ncbi:MAG: glycoside hydrolase family 2 TIM barrel-domain containing protein [Butyrivibrio sp.]
MRRYINNDWEFTDVFDYDFLHGAKMTEKVRIPHTCQEVPYNCWEASEYEMVCGYRKTIVPEESWRDKRIFVRFMGVAHVATVFFNKHELITHKCGYTEFAVELTEYLEFGRENDLVVRVDTRESANVPPFGFVIDYMTYGGIYRDVILEVMDTSYIDDVFAYGDHLGNFRCEVDIADSSVKERVYLEIKNKLNVVVYDAKGWIENGKCVFSGHIPNIIPWTTKQPVLYTLVVSLLRDKTLLDERELKIGFRTAQFKQDGFYLNGQYTKLRGLNRHQSFPYVGYAMPKSMQRLDADILKTDLGVNIVRTSHYPQSHYFIDRCDEIGLLVFTEIPGWQHIGNEEWQNQAVENTKEMVKQYRNHPSIILWGVRINESEDNDELYSRTNEAARKLDPTRATTGVRFREFSSLLEDVHAYNDFSHTGKNRGLKYKQNVTPDMNKPYIVSECNGHMFPTKAFDDEGHRLSHALRHAAVIEAMEASTDISGVIGWCMFDYNTHKDFGSGDGICYHGVTDMFRNSKLAAAVYQSQSEDETVCEVSSSMNIGEYPGGGIGDVYVFTNSDSIKLYKNDSFVKEFYPDRKKYGHMEHPPVIIDDFIGSLIENGEPYDTQTCGEIKECLRAISKYWGKRLPLKYILLMGKLKATKHITKDTIMDLYGKYVANWGASAPKYRFEAIKDGNVVKTVEKQPGIQVHLKVEADHTRLIEENETYDVAAVNIKAVDQFGNVQPYYMEPLYLQADGDIEIIGPKIICLRGGMGGTYVRSVRHGEKGVLRIVNESQPELKVGFTVE